MSDLEKKIILTIWGIGPTFISKLANRILENQNDVRDAVKNLLSEKIIQRVENVMVNYKTKENNIVVKHRNHTYYQLTKLGERKAKEIQPEGEQEIREAFKTYNKSLQNLLDNQKPQEENKIYSVIDFPYSQEQSVKKILGEDFEELSGEYGITVTMRGEISGKKREALAGLMNVVVL